MAKSLIIVESPAKARTISKYLGRGYQVLASVGHVKDLPKSKLGIDVEHDFQPQYVVIKGKSKTLTEIKTQAKKADKVFLAPDPDREGEAIAWHIAEELNGKVSNVYRVLFNEITKGAIQRALESPGTIDMKKVNAQQARRVLDRIVGYMLSPLLWKKVSRGLSAGRVQSVAVRIICEREAERDIFESVEYWTITANLQGQKPPIFEARLQEFQGKPLELHNQEDADRVLQALQNATFTVSAVEKTEKRRTPQPPFITSRLQQEASRKLRFTAKKTMMLAQRLYEGIEIGKEGPVGLITYMRTDSTRVSNEAQAEAIDVIRARFGSKYLPAKSNVYKNPKTAQEAHEAIRPTSAQRDPETVKQFLENDLYKLYKLIWNRFLASQMTKGLDEATRVSIQVGEYLFRTTGTVEKFDGFRRVYVEGTDTNGSGQASSASQTDDEEAKRLPELLVNEHLTVVEGEDLGILPKQHFTQPPTRYNESLLIKELEEKGIGRPSTYAAIISTIQDRQYVEKDEGRFKPTELGRTVNDRLVTYFPRIFDVAFTARMESELDDIEDGAKNWVTTVSEFYSPFSKDLGAAEVNMEDLKAKEEPTDIACDKCAKNMVIKWGRHGHFLACPGYPSCKNTKPFTKDGSGNITIVEKPRETTNEVCEKCGNSMVVKQGRFGTFLACSSYPDCKTTKPLSLGVKCPIERCKGELTQRRTKKGRAFYSCNQYPKCTFAIWSKPINRTCPKCQTPFLIEKYTKQAGKSIQCYQENCDYQEVE
jgi:DNA topoisomerase-1